MNSRKTLIIIVGLVAFGGTGFMLANKSQAERSRLYVPHRKIESQEAQSPQDAPIYNTTSPVISSDQPVPEPAYDTESSPPSASTYSDEGEGGTMPDAVSGYNPDEGMDDAGTMPPDMDMPACDFTQWVGKPVDEDSIKQTGRPYRILPPGAMATMDYSADRLNIHTDDNGIVIQVTCG